MTVSSVTSKISSYSDRVINGITNLLPSATIGSKKILKGIKWAGEHISSPQNRLILGVSALMSQPFIDLYNKRVDEDTRKASACRTVAKIIAGTTSGFIVRYYSIKAIEKMTQTISKNKKLWQTFFTPDSKLVKLTAKAMSQYKKTLGTLAGLLIMVATNFLFDAPVTKMLTNKFIGLVKKRDEKHNTKEHLTNQHNYLSNINSYKYKSSTNLIEIAKIKYNCKTAERQVHHD